MWTIAAIDAGSNAFRLTIGEVDEAGKVTPVDNIRLPVRLGADVFSLGHLEEASIKQMEEAFERFERVIEAAGVYTLQAVATSAMREASNGQEVADRLYAVTGIKLRIIDSGEEARLVHLAVSQAMKLEGKRTLLVDIGGGSVEVSLSEGNEIIFSNSYKIGAVRLLKMMEGQEDGSKSPAERIGEYTQSACREIEQAIRDQKIDIFVGTGGSVDEIGRLRQRLFKSESSRFVLVSELEKMIERLSGMSVEQIMNEFQLRPDRADVILPAMILLQMIAETARVKRIDIPDVSLKEGLLFSMAEELSRQPHPDRRTRLIESALHMGHKYQFDEHHAVLTAKLARQLFIQLNSVHGLGEDELLLLEVGALLHDIGHFINLIDHDKHGYYLLKVNHLIGLTPREQMIVANLARYHRGRTFFMEETDFKSLPAKDRRIILKLAAILSLADGMDISHNGRVQNADLQKTKGGWQLDLPDDLSLEKWTVTKRKTLFEDVYGVKLQTG